MVAKLRALTTARVGLERTGVSQRTQDVLAFQLSHAQARDAVHARLDAGAVAERMAKITGGPVLGLRSEARDRAEYLQRPDRGRRLDDSRALLAAHAQKGADVALVIADGLSALAVERHAAAVLERLLPRLSALHIAPLSVVEQGRVAIGDEIGAVLGARVMVVLIGERPGLSSPDSLGAYVTFAPRVGRTDAERVCLSNIRNAGLSYDEAAAQLERVISEALARGWTGVAAGQSGRALPGPGGES
ncbi:ethanolamine ammonia-lyase subunit EutC [Acidobacteria bacterium AB60]|nr:ethanolamine ammonia-lyase subunit EutC [Acidobacteria bacterium AB60]